MASDTNWFTTPENFGAVGNGTTNDATAFQNAVNSFNGNPGKVILNGIKSYAIVNTVYIPYNVSIEGNGASIIPKSGGTFVDGFMFFVNANSSKQTITPWGGELISKIKNLYMRNTNNIVNIKGFYIRNKINFTDITFSGFYKGVLKEGSMDNDYTDMQTFEGMYFVNCKGTEPLLDIQFNGDGLLIDKCHVAGVETGNYNFLNLYFCNGGKISRCVNGDIRIGKSTGMSLENWHCEHGKLIIESSQVSIKNVHQWYHQTYQPIPLTITESAADKPSLPCSIDGYYIIHPQNRTAQSKNYTTPNYFDAYFKRTKVKVTNFFRRSTMQVDPSLGMDTGVKVTLDGNTLWNDWELYNQNYSKDSYVINDKIFTFINEALCANNFTSYGVNLADHATFDGALGTYYYEPIYYFGYLDRKVARYGGGSKSATLSNKLSVPLLNIQEDYIMQLSKIRLYRGTAAGQYTHYVDIPAGNGLSIYDYGYFVSTGEKWTPRTAGGTENYNSSFTKVKIDGENMIAWGTAIPTYGTWKIGDKIINTNTASGQPKSWICTASGTPGTWMAETSDPSSISSIIETRTNDPSGAQIGRIWLRTDL